MTPLQVGDTFNSGLKVLPGLPAHVEVKVSLLINSDRAQKVEYLVQGRAMSRAERKRTSGAEQNRTTERHVVKHQGLSIPVA